MDLPLCGLLSVPGTALAGEAREFGLPIMMSRGGVAMCCCIGRLLETRSEMESTSLRFSKLLPHLKRTSQRQKEIATSFNLNGIYAAPLYNKTATHASTVFINRQRLSFSSSISIPPSSS